MQKKINNLVNTNAAYLSDNGKKNKNNYLAK